jgi:lysophospholipase L1-like esterase
MALSAPPAPLRNADFESGLDGWTPEGDAGIETAAALTGGRSLRLGPGTGAVWQRVPVGGLRILTVGVSLQGTPPSVAGQVRVQCYDRQDRLVMDLAQPLDPKKTDGTGIYFKTHARTVALVVRIEKTSPEGKLLADRVTVRDEDQDRRAHPTTVDLDRSLRPLWQGSRIDHETVLLVSERGMPARGRLLQVPRRIVAIQDYGRTRTYRPGRDVTIDGRTLVGTDSARLPGVKDTDFAARDLKWYDIAGKHVVVTYEHRGAWAGPRPPVPATSLTGTLRRLRTGAPLTIVATGDSITLGVGTSSHRQIPPYQPTWPELCVHALHRRYPHARIELINAALGGMTSDWGSDTAPSAVASLAPDLVWIAFGMNDFWWMPAERFCANIARIVSAVRARNPHAEFVLVASMRFDPAYAQDPQYAARLASYVPALRSLTGSGVALLDMHALTGALYAAKKPRDFLSDPLHPNDFLARIYAQGMAALLGAPESGAMRS